MRLLKGKYNSHILCVSSLVYLFAGLVILEQNLNLSILLFIVTIFSVLYHGNFHNFSLKALDWVFGLILFVYVWYLFSVRFDVYIFVFLCVLLAFRLVDHFLFKTRRYGIFSYTHSFWHLLTGIIIVLLFIFIKT